MRFAYLTSILICYLSIGCVLRRELDDIALVGAWRKESTENETMTSQLITFTESGVYSYRFEILLGLNNGNSYFEKGTYIYTDQGLTLENSDGIGNYKYNIETQSGIKVMELKGKGTLTGLYYAQ